MAWASTAAAPAGWRESLTGFIAGVRQEHNRRRAEYEASNGSGSCDFDPLLREKDAFSVSWLPFDVANTTLPAKGYFSNEKWPTAEELRGFQPDDMTGLNFHERVAFLFLISRKFDEPSAMKRFFHFRELCIGNGFRFTFEDPDVQLGLSQGVFLVGHPTPLFDDGGSPVFSVFPRRLDWTKTTAEQMKKAWFYALISVAFLTPNAQVHGVCMTNSMKDVGYSNMKMDFQKFILSALQGGMPIKVKIGFLGNEPWLMRTMSSVMFAMVSEKLRSRINVISTDYDKVLAKVPAAAVPEELGGTRDGVSEEFLQRRAVLQFDWRA